MRRGGIFSGCDRDPLEGCGGGIEARMCEGQRGRVLGIDAGVGERIAEEGQEHGLFEKGGLK